MIRALAIGFVGSVGVGAALTACVHDHYACHEDSDCNLGDGGRCELDHRCTQYDTACSNTMRSYTDHSGDASGTCFEGLATPLDYCAAGQSPAPLVGCAATVCATLPACCTVGWSEACVLEAQQQCPAVTCDTRIAISAQKGTAAPELWTATYDPGSDTWTATARAELQQVIAYAAPATGDTEPRLVSFAAADTLVLETSHGVQSVAVDATHSYRDVQSLDFDRDLRDTLVLDSMDQTQEQFVDLVKVDTGATRLFDVSVSSRIAWGATNQDGFPDGVAAVTAANGNPGGRYNFLTNVDFGTHHRELDFSVSTGFSGQGTPNSAATRSFTWADVNGDGLLDLVAFGNSLRVHVGGGATGTQPVSDTPFIAFDCFPLTLTSDATNCSTTTQTGASVWAGAVVPATATSAATIIAAAFPQRALYQISLTGPMGFTASLLDLPTTGACPTCAIEAVIVRDLDGDHVPDIIAIDTQLDFDIGRATATGYSFTEVRPIIPVTPSFNIVRTSTSGAQR